MSTQQIRPEFVEQTHTALKNLLNSEDVSVDQLITEFVAWTDEQDSEMYVPHEAFSEGHIRDLVTLREEDAVLVIEWLENAYPGYAPDGV